MQIQKHRMDRHISCHSQIPKEEKKWTLILLLSYVESTTFLLYIEFPTLVSKLKNLILLMFVQFYYLYEFAPKIWLWQNINKLYLLEQEC
jgi:hypothetical protein